MKRISQSLKDVVLTMFILTIVDNLNIPICRTNVASGLGFFLVPIFCKVEYIQELYLKHTTVVVTWYCNFVAFNLINRLVYIQVRKYCHERYCCLLLKLFIDGIVIKRLKLLTDAKI